MFNVFHFSQITANGLDMRSWLTLGSYAVYLLLNESSLPVGSLSRAKYNISYIYGTLKIYRYVQKKVKR